MRHFKKLRFIVELDWLDILMFWSNINFSSAMEKLFGSLYLGWIILCGGWWSYVLKLKSEAGLHLGLCAKLGGYIVGFGRSQDTITRL